MVQKTAKGPRGRPKAYDPQVALQRAMEAFWKFGYSGTSLDQLSDATDMNRPSMYGAFGDKHALYVQTLERYVKFAQAATQAALALDVEIEQALRNFYAAAVGLYVPAGAAARGCYMITTAVTEAAVDDQVRLQLQALLSVLDEALRARLEHAKQAGELHADADPQALALTASAFLHTLAIRSRAGASRRKLDGIIEIAVAQICARPSRKNAGKPAARPR